MEESQRIERTEKINLRNFQRNLTKRLKHFFKNLTEIVVLKTAVNELRHLALGSSPYRKAISLLSGKRNQ